MKKAVAFLTIVFLLLAIYPAAVSAVNEEPAIDVMFVMDLSGSMRTADREKVSLTSVAVFADMLADSSSQIGFVTFSDDVLQSMPLTPVDQARSSIHNNLLTSEFGGWTNIPAALDSALNLLNQSSSANQKVVILFTDGNVELPQNSGITNTQGEDKCRELASAFKDAEIPIYTVGLNYDGTLDLTFIQELSDLSSPLGRGAKSYGVKTNWDIPEVFSKIYISLYNGNADVGLEFNSADRTQTALFTVEEGVYELNVLLIHTSRLENLEVLYNGYAYSGAEFKQRDGYSFVKIRYPDTGEWEFSFQGDYISANKQVRYISNTGTNVTITFNTDGGVPLDPIQLQIGATLPDMQNPQRDGYRFEGWYLNEARTQAVTGGTTFSRDTMLYARWVPQILRNVTVSGDGVTPQTMKLPDGDRLYNHVQEPVRKGFVFVGWQLADGTITDVNTLIDADMTLTAHWEALVIDVIPTIVFFVLSACVFAAGMIFGKKLFSNNSEKSTRLCAMFSAAFAVLNALTYWALEKAYVIPYEVMTSQPARDAAAAAEFASAIDTYLLFGGLLLPVVMNVLLASVLPLLFVSPASRFGKEKQYITHLLVTVSGLLPPVLMWVVYGAGTSMIWLLILAFLSCSVNFFLSATLFRQGNNSMCSRFFFDV